MANGILYSADLVKLLTGFKEGNQNVLFEMEDGSIKNMAEIKDFHTVKAPLKKDVIHDRILTELFGKNYIKAKTIDVKHLTHVMALLDVILDHTSEQVLKKAAGLYEIHIRRGPEENKKILSELLRE